MTVHKSLSGPGSVVGTGYGLRAGRSGDRIAVGARFSAPVQTGPGAHPASCTMGTGFFPGVKSGLGVTLTPHPLLVPWSWKGRAIPLLPLWAVRPVQGVYFTFASKSLSNNVLLNGLSVTSTFRPPFVFSLTSPGKRFYAHAGFTLNTRKKASEILASTNPHLVGKGCNDSWNQFCSFQIPSLYLTLILPRSHTGTVWFYTSTSNKRAARPKLYTKSLTRDLERMYSRLTLVRISINL